MGKWVEVVACILSHTDGWLDGWGVRLVGKQITGQEQRCSYNWPNSLHSTLSTWPFLECSISQTFCTVTHLLFHGGSQLDAPCHITKPYWETSSRSRWTQFLVHCFHKPQNSRKSNPEGKTEVVGTGIPIFVSLVHGL